MIKHFWGIDDNDDGNDGDDRDLRTSVGKDSPEHRCGLLTNLPSPSSQYSDLPI